MNDRRYPAVLATIIGVILLGGSAPPVSAAETYAQQIRELNRAIRSHDDSLADRILLDLRRRYGSNPEVIAIWLSRQCSRGDFRPYDTIGGRLAGKSHHAELEHALRTCRQLQRFSWAQRHLDKGDTAAAIRIAEPLYASGPDFYRAGLILARAYLAERRLPEARKIYAELAGRYPHDPDLAAQAVILLARTHRTWAANRSFQTLTPEQKHIVLTALAGDQRLLYPHSITVAGGLASSSGDMPADNNVGLRLRMDTRFGTVVGEVEHTHRFGEGATSYGVHYYQALGAGYGGEIAVSHSPSGTFLAQDSLTLALSRDLGSYSLYASARHLIYSDTVANVLFGGIGFDVDGNLTVKTGLFYVPETNAYSVMLAPVWKRADGSRIFLYLTAGMAGDQIDVSGSIKRAPSFGIKLGRTVNLSSDLSLMGDVFYEHRTGLYDRSGVESSVTKRW